jgi:biopolymer transport protein ExbD
MSMRSSRSDDNDPMVEMNVTPLVDVMLVLLVIFIVTAPLIVPQAIKIDLPQTGLVQPQEPVVNHTLLMKLDGGMHYNNQVVSEAQLVSQLQNDQAKGPIQLQIHADEAVPYGRMAAVMALVQSAGVTNLSFVILHGIKSQ